MNVTSPSYETRELREFAETLRARRSIDLYLQVPVPDNLVEEAIEVATWAPNHHVTEPWRYYRLGEETKRRCLDLCHDIVLQKKDVKAADFKKKSWAEKPGWLVVTCQRSDDALRQHEDYAACCASIQNLILYLWKAGVGSKWTTGDITRDARFLEIIGIDGSEAFVVGLVWYGYAKLTPSQSRKAVSEIASKLP